ncbi:MAG: hypothetical protein PHH04_08855 [Thomasclavelia sp.]|nr:hypothetical protein [Thomasclavelia sp.]
MGKEIVLFKINSILYLRDQLEYKDEEIAYVVDVPTILVPIYYQIGKERNARTDIKIS